MLFYKFFEKLKSAINGNTEKSEKPNSPAPVNNNSEKPQMVIDEKTKEQVAKHLQKAFDEYEKWKSQLQAADNDTTKKPEKLTLPTAVNTNSEKKAEETNSPAPVNNDSEKKAEEIPPPATADIRFIIKDNTVLTGIECPMETKKINVPNGVKRINRTAFSSCTAVEEITLPPTVAEIDSDSFSKCQNLKSISIPFTINSIGLRAFNCNCKVYFYSEKGTAQLYPYCFGANKTSDINARLAFIKSGNFNKPDFLTESGRMQSYTIFEESLKLASSAYIITESENALDFIRSNMEPLIITSYDNTADLLKKLIDKNLIDDDTLLKFLKSQLVIDTDHRIVPVIMDYLNNQRNIGLYEIGQIELVKYIRMVCPVPYEKIYFRIIRENDTLHFNYCYIEKNTDFITSMSTEEKRYGYILDYRRDPEIFEILNDRGMTFCELYNEKYGDKPWKAVTFTVKSDSYDTEFEYETIAAVDDWEKACTGGISADFSQAYPVELLKEDSKAYLCPAEIPRNTEDMTVKDYYELLKKCCDYLGSDYMTMEPPLPPERIEPYRLKFDVEPDKDYSDYMEWLYLCSELTINDWIIYSGGSVLRDDNYEDDNYSHIASSTHCVYGISCDTGKCRAFDHDFGDDDCSFLNILDRLLESVSDCVSEVEDERENEFLIKNHRALSDSYAEFLARISGDRIKNDAENARTQQLEYKNNHRFLFYDDNEIVPLYKKYIDKLNSGK